MTYARRKKSIGFACYSVSTAAFLPSGGGSAESTLCYPLLDDDWRFSIPSLASDCSHSTTD
jgi:hypothetical protein